MLTAIPAILLLALAQTPQDDLETAAAQQEQVQADAEQATEEAQPEEEKVRCRYEQLVNTRIPSRVCRTEAEWDRIEQANREARENNARNRGSRGESGTIYGADGLN